MLFIDHVLIVVDVAHVVPRTLKNGMCWCTIKLGYYCWLRYERNNNMGYCLCSRNWIVYIWTGFDNWTQLQD